MENTQITIREIDPNSETEIALVACNMRRTLVEVLGVEKGTALYSMEWLLERVRWHLDPNQALAKIFLGENAGRIISHTIARLEKDSIGERFGYFSTIFVDPGWRNKGIAGSMLVHTTGWLASLDVPRIVYNTAENHSKLIRLFRRHGFEISHRQGDMVQLTKFLK